MRDFKKLYVCLLESEDLHTMYAGLTGEWDKDQKKFIKYQTELESLANVIDTDLDEE